MSFKKKSSDEEDQSIHLTVAEAKNRDVIRGKIRIDSHAMTAIGVSTGDEVEIVGPNKRTAAIAWPSYPEDINRSIIRMDGVIRGNCGVSINEKVTIRRAVVNQAKFVLFAQTNTGSNQLEIGFEAFMKKKLLGFPLTEGDTVLIPVLGRANPFVVQDCKPEGIVVVTEDTELKISDKPIDDQLGATAHLSYEDIGGLDEVIQKLREMVELPLRHPELFEKLGIDPPKGVLLHGPPGCGKTMIAKAVANETDAHFIALNGPEIMSKYYGESEQRLRSIFREALEKAPTIIFIDEIDSVAPKREETTGEVERRVVAQLLASMDGIGGRGHVIVIAATNRESAIDPALRRPGRFDREIEIGVPSAEGRYEILQIHTRGMPLAEDVSLKYFADTTHGMVGADLKALARESAMRTLRRFLPEIDLEADTIPTEILTRMEVTNDDFVDAASEIQPSALREVFVEVPDVKFSDIGGLSDVIELLKETVEWPIKHPAAFTRMGITPPAGVLLYGPPGTGKTMLAKAVANEAEANFISIKGPELLNKFVGESERGIREVFRKARLASPTVIFFDEIDSIAPRRGIGAENSVTERVVSQILTEIDGLEVLNNVIVIASTNRPDIIDPALLRPGRFDRLLYVRPPTYEGRKDILDIYFRNMPLDEHVDLEEMARNLEGFVGSDIEALAREAGLNALRKDIHTNLVTNQDVLDARDKVHATMTAQAKEYYEKIEKTLKTAHAQEKADKIDGFA